jgi:CubicO group peptidase (beta-lactamase class C family)
MTYTEADIRELSGVELRVAVELLVRKDDLTANTDERIEQAIESGWRPGGIWKWDGREFGYSDVLWSVAGNIWGSRSGQPYEASIEQHVANWRAEPLPMGLEWCVPELMGPGGVLEGWDLSYNQQFTDMWACVGYGEWAFATADDPATAIKRAACLVKLRKGE